MGTEAPSYAGFRFPAEIISHCVWLYHRFPLSFREVEEMMLERGIMVSHETIRQWCAKFDQTYANALRRRRPRPGDKWHLDEVFITINGKRQYLWRAVDQRFLSAFSGISPHFRPGRHRLGAKEYRREMTDRFTTWNEVTGTATSA